MTIAPLRQSINFWQIAIVHQDGYNWWPVKSFPWEVFVSAKGHPTTRSAAQFETRDDAALFLEINRPTIDRRCANKIGFIDYEIVASASYWPTEFDKPINLAKKT